MDRIFELPAFLGLFGLAIIAGIVGAIRGGRAAATPSATADPSDRPSAMGGAAESFFLTLFGGFVARIVIAGLLDLGNESEGVRLAVGWAFFVIPGIIDTIPSFFGAQPMTNVSVLLWLATGVGAVTGMLAGIYRIYNWRGLGILQLIGDTTWGLAGSTTGALVALINIAIGDHSDEERKGAHRYIGGFRLKGTFAFTQGNVMSNLSETETGSLYKHERLHVFQNRAFGPFFGLTYLGWMAVWIIPSAIASLVKWNPRYIEGWTYRSNPWEIWAYHVQRKADGLAEGSDARYNDNYGPFIFSEVVGLIFAVPYMILAVAGLVIVAFAVL